MSRPTEGIGDAAREIERANRSAGQSLRESKALRKRAESAERELSAALKIIIEIRRISGDGIQHNEYCNDKCGACRIANLLG